MAKKRPKKDQSKLLTMNVCPVWECPCWQWDGDTKWFVAKLDKDPVLDYNTNWVKCPRHDPDVHCPEVGC